MYMCYCGQGKMRIKLLILAACLSKVMMAAVITNHPQDITVCVNKYANIPCGFTGADPDETNWHILKWDGNGGIASFDTVSVTEINRNTTDGLVWVPDQHNGNGSCLIVGPVTKADNRSTYQCNLNETTLSNVGTLTVLDPPSIDSIWANSVSDTTVDIRWNSSSAVSYYNVLISGDVETTFTTKDTWCIIHGVVKHKPYRISVVPVSQLCEGEVAHVTVTTGTASPVITRSTAMTPTMTVNVQDGDGSYDQMETMIIVIWVLTVLAVVIFAVFTVICVIQHFQLFGNCDVNHLDDQDERALNTTPSSTYIPLSDDNPTPQDTDGVHDD